MKPDRKNVAVANFILLPHAYPRVASCRAGFGASRGSLLQGSHQNPGPRPLIWDRCAIAG